MLHIFTFRSLHDVPSFGGLYTGRRPREEERREKRDEREGEGEKRERVQREKFILISSFLTPQTSPLRPMERAMTLLLVSTAQRPLECHKEAKKKQNRGRLERKNNM